MPPKNLSVKPDPSAKPADSADQHSAAQTNSRDLDGSLRSNARATSTHIFFWGGILSNWWLDSPPFSGETCLQHMIFRLDQLRISHPHEDAVSTRILSAHQFVCGEQWMMAVKAWLFERTSVLGEMLVRLEQDADADGVIGKVRFERLKDLVKQAKIPKDISSNSQEHDLYDGTLYAVLRSHAPRQQKALGRGVSGFVDKVWNDASVSIVIASCIARAEVDPALRQVYVDAGARKFVEGSPMDKIWGVGLKWDNPRIDDERNWKGQNRLGECHDAAAKYIREEYSA